MKVIVLILLLSSTVAFAREKANDVTWEIFPLNGQARFEAGEEQDLTPRQTLNFAFGAQRAGYGLELEYSQFSVKTGSGFSGVDRDHKELMMWIRRDFAGTGKLRWLAGAGTGFSQDEVTTRIDQLHVTDNSKAEPLAAVSLGPQLTVLTFLRVSLEGRLFFGAGFDPNPQPDLLVRTGIVF